MSKYLLMMAQEDVMTRWLWICPILGVLMSVTAFFYWGWSWTTAGLVVLIMIWGAVQFRQLHANDVQVGRKKNGR